MAKLLGPAGAGRNPWHPRRGVRSISVAALIHPTRRRPETQRMPASRADNCRTASRTSRPWHPSRRSRCIGTRGRRATSSCGMTLLKSSGTQPFGTEIHLDLLSTGFARLRRTSPVAKLLGPGGAKRRHSQAAHAQGVGSSRESWWSPSVDRRWRKRPAKGSRIRGKESACGGQVPDEG